jgi:hypothetical protein
VPGRSKPTGFEFFLNGLFIKNNIFVDNISPTKQYMMFSTSLTDHFNNIFVPAKAQVGSLTLGATEQKIDLASLAFTSDYRLTSASTPAIDKGVAVDMTTNNSVATTAIDPTIFASVFNQDIDKHQVACGAGVDIGASEYCEGADGATGAGGAKGTVATASSGGAAGTVIGGSTGSAGAKGTGGVAGTGGKQGMGGAASSGGVTRALNGLKAVEYQEIERLA